MALILIVLCTLTVAALEVFLSGNESLSAIEAAMTSMGSAELMHHPVKPTGVEMHLAQANAG
jgi:hypothetical protein